MIPIKNIFSILVFGFILMTLSCTQKLSVISGEFQLMEIEPGESNLDQENQTNPLVMLIDRDQNQVTFKIPEGEDISRKLLNMEESDKYISNPCPTQSTKTILHEWLRIEGETLQLGEKEFKEPILLRSCFDKSTLLTDFDKVDKKVDPFNIDLSDAWEFK